jgi:molybdopterin synthase catalytic subunit/molybdopterin converting factor small subunit
MSRIRYHAAARELAGVADEQVAHEGTLAELRALLATRHPRLAPFLPRMRFALDGELAADEGSTVDARSEIDVLPPVAGGSPSEEVPLADVRDAPLSIDEVYRAVQHAGAGGVCLFVGVVRDHAEGKAVARLEYEAHPTLAIPELRRVLEQVAREVPGTRVAAVHRAGALVIGDLAVVVAASAAHRAEAFAACRLAIDRLKETVPIWKKEHEPSGAAVWVNLGEAEPEE